MIKQTIGATLVVLLAAAGAVQAEPGQGQRRGQGPAPLEQMDTDGDDAVSEAEFLAAHTERLKRRFAKMDQNGDGVLTRDEFRHARKKQKNRPGPGEGQRDQADGDEDEEQD